MTIVNDESVFNDASAQGNWTASSFDSPTDNDTNASPSIYREGTICQQWILKENITGGYTYTSTLGGTKNISNGEIVIFWFFITADADLDKLTEFDLQLSSDTGFTTNNARWDASQQIYDLDYYGWYPVAVYPSNPDHVTGTIVYSSIDSVGWYASTGAAGTKLSGFDQCHSISYLGGHSQTVTLTNLYDNSITNDLGVVLKFSDFFKFQVSIRLGGGTTTNMVFNETGKTLFFDNVQADHNLGFIFVDNTTGTNTFDLDGWGISWNQQTGTTPQIFTDPEHCDIFRVNGCTFSRGGDFECRAWISDANTFVTNTTINNCDRIDPRDIYFQNNTITDSRITAVDDGALLIDAEWTPSRQKNLSFTRGSSSHAMVITATGSYELINFSYADYGAIASNTATIRNESGGAVTITVTGGDTPTYQNGTGASTTIVAGAVTVQATAVLKDGTVVENARVYLKASDGTGPFPFEESVTITRSGTVATVAHTGHGMDTGDKVTIMGITDKIEDNGTVFTITVTGVNAYTYTTTNSGSTSYTGTIISTFVALSGLTNVSGVLSTTRVYLSDQPLVGWTRKSTSSPYLQEGVLVGTVDSSTGFAGTAVMLADE